MVEERGQARAVGGRRRAEAAGTYWHAWFWEAEALVLTDACHLDVCHRHVAVQVVVSLGDRSAMRLERGDWHVSRGTVVASDVPHAYDSRSQPSLGLWLDPTSTVGRTLAERYLAEADLAVLDEELSRRVGAAAPRGARPRMAPPAARAVFDHAVDELVGRPARPLVLDPRVAAVLHRLAGATRLPPVATLASQVGLSSSRLQHLVRDQIGISLGRWLVWRRMLVATERMLQGSRVTEAAHDAGFADGPEFTRTFREFFATAPTAILQDPRVHVRVCGRSLRGAPEHDRARPAAEPATAGRPPRPGTRGR